jgi:signal transduction histidine kinase/ligand-binding sensor domain-containing protein
MIYALHEDADGALWVAVDGGGLSRFDPLTEKFEQFRHADGVPGSLANDHVRDVRSDPQGRLWVATDDGLDRWDHSARRFVHYRHDPAVPTSFSHNRIKTLFVDRSGTLWVGTAASLERYEPRTDSFVHYREVLSGRTGSGAGGVLSIAQNGAGDLWVGTSRGGLVRLDPRSKQVTRYANDPRKPDSLSSDRVWSVAVDSTGTVWAGTEAGLNRLVHPSGRFEHYRHDPGNSYSLADDIVYSLYEDRSGVLWVGTFSQGLSRLSLRAEKFGRMQHIPNQPTSLTGGAVASLVESRDGHLWVGNFSNGFDHYDPKSGLARHYRRNPLDPNSLSDDSINAIYEDRDGIVWIGTDAGGLDRFDPKNGRFGHYRHAPADPASIGDNGIWSLYEDRQGRFWVGTKSSLDLFDRRLGRFRRYRHRDDVPTSIARGPVRAILEDRQGRLWLGFQGSGLDRFDPETGRFVHYSHQRKDESSLSNNNVWSLWEDAQGAIWAGTDLGINRLDPETGRFEHFTEEQGLANNTGCAILGDRQGRLWVATNHGLSRFDPRTRSFRNYNYEDGLQAEEFNAGARTVGSDGRLYFGGTDGINVIEPERVADSTYLPPVVLTEFRRGNSPPETARRLWEERTVELSYTDLVFSLKFAALDYVAPDRNRYRYQLEGFDQKWNRAGERREATYTNLDAGTYRFRVQATNSDGIWNEVGATLTITIQPPPWKTPWAYAAYGLAALGGIYGFVHLRTRAQRLELERQRQLNQTLEQKVDERTAALRLATQRAEEARRVVELVNRITDQVRASLDEKKILQTAVHELATVLSLERCRAGLYNSERTVSTVAYECATTGAATLGQTMAMAGAEEPYGTLLAGRPLQFCTGGSAGEEPTQTVLAVPIVDDQGVLGDLWLFRGRTQAFDTPEIRLVQQVADQCAIAVRQARLYQTSRSQVSELERLNRLKDEFVGTVSHELRTPLANIKMSVHMLERVLRTQGLLDADGRFGNYLNILRNECRREIGLVNDLLDLSQLESGAPPLKLTVLDLPTWLPGVVEPFAVRAAQNHQTLQIQAPEAGAFLTDRTYLERMLGELLNNACKYTPTDEKIRVDATLDAGGLRLSVTNTGVEILPHEQERIFEKFYRIPSKDPYKHGGTGLGLALVRKLVQRLGGTVEVKSADNRTTFTLQLPPIDDQETI